MRGLWIVLLILGGSFHVAAEDGGPRPSVILMMADDLGWGDVGFTGSTVAKTPHLDALAADSLRFDRFYAAAPVCSPTRGSALTGRHPFRYGITFANVGHLQEEERTLAQVLQAAGYATGHFGKWHLGTLTTETRDGNRGFPGRTEHFAPPWLRGFDVCFSTESKVPTWDPVRVPLRFGPEQDRHYGWIGVEDDAPTEHYGTYYWDESGQVVEDNLAGDDSRVIMDRAVDFIRAAAGHDQPFLAVIWFHTPHLPVVTGSQYRAMYADLPLREQLYYGCITAMDDQVGRLHELLVSLDLAEDTMWWFCSDNGPENNTPGSAGPFRGRKRSLYEGGIRVPAFLHWPARIAEGRTTDVPSVTSDYLPTVLEVLDLPRASAPEPLDGISLLPLLEGRMDQRPRPIGFQSGNMAAWTSQQYKLVLRNQKASPELYDLVADPAERRDLAAEHPEIVDRMLHQLRQWQQSCRDSAAQYKPAEKGDR
jgi:arylsulfatase A-like enzyme